MFCVSRRSGMINRVMSYEGDKNFDPDILWHMFCGLIFASSSSTISTRVSETKLQKTVFDILNKGG